MPAQGAAIWNLADIDSTLGEIGRARRADDRARLSPDAVGGGELALLLVRVVTLTRRARSRANVSTL
jgi:hypothetical protein